MLSPPGLARVILRFRRASGAIPAQSFRFGPRQLNHLGPLLGFFNDELVEVGREGKRGEWGTRLSGRYGDLAGATGAAGAGGDGGRCGEKGQTGR
jgi:hypothetical protein